MNVQTVTSSLSHQFGLAETELIHKSLRAFIEKEIRLAELEIANIRERYTVFSKEELYQAIQDGTAVEHPAWEDYIIWKNKVAHIAYLRQLATEQLVEKGRNRIPDQIRQSFDHLESNK